MCTMLTIRILCLFAATMLLSAEPEDKSNDRRDPTVGAAGWVSEIILPGSELQGKPLNPDAPIVVRIQKSFAHGDSFRYDIQFHGLEPGEYDLAKWLERKDGSDAAGLPEIPVKVRSLLPPGQVEPNPLEQGLLPRLGGYRVVAAVVTIAWLAVLLGLIFSGRKKKQVIAEEIRPKTLAQLLRPRLAAAARNEIQPQQYAELERMLFAFWRKRLGLKSESADSAMAKIKRDETAGPLMKQLESWMHDPDANRDADLAELLKPYENISAEEVEDVA